MTDLLAAVLAQIWAYWLSIYINLDHICKLHASSPPSSHPPTHNVDVWANLWYAGVICVLAQQRHVVLVFIVPVITGRMQDLVGYDSHTPLSMFIEQAHYYHRKMCLSSGMHGKYSLASVWWWWKVKKKLCDGTSQSQLYKRHPHNHPPHTHIYIHTNTEIATYVHVLKNAGTSINTSVYRAETRTYIRWWPMAQFLTEYYVACCTKA